MLQKLVSDYIETLSCDCFFPSIYECNHLSNTYEKPIPLFLRGVSLSIKMQQQVFNTLTLPSCQQLIIEV